MLHGDKKLDAFGLYLFGVVLKEKGLLGPSDGRKHKVVMKNRRNDRCMHVACHVLVDDLPISFVYLNHLQHLVVIIASGGFFNDLARP